MTNLEFVAFKIESFLPFPLDIPTTVVQKQQGETAC